jgi:hypothetical protein
MTTLTPAALALLAFVAQKNCVPAYLSPLAVGIALHENPSLDPRAVNHNANGTIDAGLAQVNQVNWVWTGIAANPFDVCGNLNAGLRVFFARYNGNPPDEVKAAYSTRAMARAVDAAAIPTPDHTPDAQPTPQDEELHDAVHFHHVSLKTVEAMR